MHKRYRRLSHRGIVWVWGKIPHDKQHNGTLLYECIAVLPPCQCMLLSTAITSRISVHFVNNGAYFLSLPAWQEAAYVQLSTNHPKQAIKTMIWLFYTCEFTCISTLWEQLRRRFAPRKSDLATKAKSKKNAPSALLSISKQSNSVEEPMCRTAGLIFSGPCVGCFWGKKKNTGLSLRGPSREPPMWNVPENN